MIQTKDTFKKEIENIFINSARIREDYVKKIIQNYIMQLMFIVNSIKLM